MRRFLAGAFMALSVGRELTDPPVPIPRVCYQWDPDFIKDLLRQEADRLSAHITRVLARRSPYLDLLEANTFPTIKHP